MRSDPVASLDRAAWETLGARLGLRLSAYRREQVARRLSAYMRLNGYPDASALLGALAARPQEVERLRSHLTIHVTEFLRDPPYWERLASVLRAMPARPLWRVWSAAAADGAEALTAALLLEEAGVLARLLLTDIDPVMLEAARRGRYGEAELRRLDPARRRRILLPPDRRETAWRVRPQIAAGLAFRQLDLLHDAYPPGPFDLILCRNVLIYFHAPEREQVLDRLASRLSADGLLFLGATELISRPERHGLVWVAPALYRADPALRSP